MWKFSPNLPRKRSKSLLQKYALEEKKNIAGFSAHAQRAIESYPWPGNVRELENTIERMVVLSRGEELSVEALPQKIRDADEAAGRTGIELPPQGLRLDELERDLIRQALERHGGNRTHAARDLGLTRNTLLYRMQKHGLR